MVTDSIPFVELKTVDSTNSWLIEQTRSGHVTLPCAVVAEQQTGGRGRAGRAWQAKPGASLCLSIGWPLPVQAPSWVTLVAGAQILELLHEKGATEVGLKWPNDLVVGRRKLGGVLCESLTLAGQPLVVVGIGINLKPLTTTNPSVSLHELGAWAEGEQTVSLATALATRVTAGLTRAMEAGFSGTATYFRRHDVYLGQQVCLQDSGQILFQGRAAGVDEHGAYLIETATGLQSIESGDLSLREVAQ